jgi:hypothetical protein
MTQSSHPSLQELRTLALEFCETVAIISGSPDVRPWNTNQILWAGRRSPAPANPVFSYHQLDAAAQSSHVAILGVESRACFSRFAAIFGLEARYRESYGESFLRDMLVGLLQLSLPDSPITPVPSPYWKRYVAPAVAQLRAGSPDRYADAVVTAIGALPVPHPATVVVLPLAGVHVLTSTVVAGVTLVPEASCTGDPDLAHCGMFLHRLKELRSRADGIALTFAKLQVNAEPGLAVQRAVARVEQLCRMLRVLPNPGLADGPLANPPRIDLDASDSAAFYIAETSVGTHPIPVRRTTSEPQGRIASWRVEPRLASPAWSRLARLIEAGPANDVEARVLTALRHLGDACAEPDAAIALATAATAIDALLAPPEGDATPAQLAVTLARHVARTGEEALHARAGYERVSAIRQGLRHDLSRTVSPEERAEAIWLAFSLLETLLEHPELRGYRDLVPAR